MTTPIKIIKMRKIMRILLVEEDGSSEDGVQKGLKQYGYTVDRLSERKILLSFIKTELFEVILFNLNSSEVSKLSVLYKIRAAGISVYFK